MLKREDRAAKAAQWLEHLRAWRSSGEPLAAYVRRQDLRLWEAYRWRRLLRRDGLWSEATALRRSASVPVRFARVERRDAAQVIAARGAPSLLLRLSLANGRRAELEVADVEQLVDFVVTLERRA
ncbi:MAG TPA: hypothetical protein VHK24_10730 [Steroidobacter sp.]|jgi:hypothetical protein|nr:hypothetical protein [Steroidobacter sp.]